MTNNYLTKLLELAEENGFEAIGYFDKDGTIIGVSIGEPEFIDDIELLLTTNTKFH